jgi:hypothetical protein
MEVDVVGKPIASQVLESDLNPVAKADRYGRPRNQTVEGKEREGYPRRDFANLFRCLQDKVYVSELAVTVWNLWQGRGWDQLQVNIQRLNVVERPYFISRCRHRFALTAATNGRRVGVRTTGRGQNKN